MPDAFDVGEPVLCSHGVALYDAKVVGVGQQAAGPPSGETLYVVHYLGWKKTWDETVPASRLKKRTEANLKLKEELSGQMAAAMRKDSKKSARTSESDASARASAARRKLGSDAPTSEGKRPRVTASADASGAEEGAEAPASEPAGAAPQSAAGQPASEPVKIQLVISQQLKIKLVSDWESVTRERKLVPLPRSPSVARILDDFCASKARRSSHERLYTEVRAGVSSYFRQVRDARSDPHAAPLCSSARARRSRARVRAIARARLRARQALGQVLLYGFERKQFDDLASSSELAARPVDEVYGAEHLLRLLVKLPNFLEATRMGEDQRLVLQAKLQELLKFIQKNHASLFVESYVPAPKEYQEWWEAKERDAAAAAPPRRTSGSRPPKKPAGPPAEAAPLEAQAAVAAEAPAEANSSAPDDAS